MVMTQTKPFTIAKEITVYPESNEVELQECDQITHVNLEPRVMKVLLLLAKNEGKVIAREQFIDEIWDNYESADEALTQAISLLRKKINDSDGNNRIIETVPKKGYKLNRPVQSKPPYEKEDTEKPSLSKPINRNIILFLAIVILLVIAYAIFDSVNSQESVAPEAPKAESVK